MEDNLDIFAGNTAQFDAYLRGEMPREERPAFEKRLAGDSQFRRDFDLHRALLGSLKRNKEREHWRERLRESRQPAQPATKPAFSRWWLLALLLLVAGGLYWFFSHDDIGKRSDPAVPIAGQGGDRNQPGLFGADGPEHSTQTLPVLRITVQAGRKIAAPGNAPAVLDIHSSRESRPAGHIRSDRVQLYLPEKSASIAGSYRLIRLVKNGVEMPILQVGTDFYTLPAEDGYLEKVMDAEVIRWLR